MPIKFLLLGGGGGSGFFLEGGGGSAKFIFMGVGIFPREALECHLRALRKPRGSTGLLTHQARRSHSRLAEGACRVPGSRHPWTCQTTGWPRAPLQVNTPAPS